MTDEQILDRGRRGRATRGAPSCTSSAGCTTSCRTSGTSNVVRIIHDALPATAPEGVDGRRVGLVRAADRPADAGPARRVQGRRPGQPARRRGGDLPPRGPRQDLRAQGRRRRSGCASTARRTSSACARTRRCSTATSRRPEHRIDHLIRLRELQDETGGFQTFIPLAFHPDNTPLGQGHPQAARPDGPEDDGDRRLMLDNFPHIKAYWVMLGIKTAQVALSYGADDIDGTVVHEKIYHDAGSDSPQELTRGRAAPADRGGRPRAGRARHALPRGGAKRTGRPALAGRPESGRAQLISQPASPRSIPAIPLR